MQIVVVGASHQSSSLAVRDRLFVEAGAIPHMLGTLHRTGIAQAMVVSTCDRTEVVFAHHDPRTAAPRVREVLADHAGMPADEIAQQLYVLTGNDAIHHLFRVVCSLDSQIIGEPHVLGQVKASHQAAQTVGMTGRELEAILQAAYAVAKRVRTETGIGQRPVSIASAAAEMARRLHGDLNRCAALLLGLGEMGQIIAETLASHRVGHLVVIHPQHARAEAVSRTLNCHLGSFEALNRCLVDADIVIAALGARRATVTAEMTQTVLRQRRYKPIFMIDAAVPGDIDPAVDHVDGCFRYTLGDLERIVLEGRTYRETEVPAALRMVDDAAESFLRNRAERAAVPLMTALHHHFEGARRDALRDAAGDADKATRLLVARLLHRPSAALKALAGEDESSERDAVERAVKRLFGITGGDREGEE